MVSSPCVCVGTAGLQYEHVTLTFSSEILALGYRLFPLLALALDMPEDFFADKTRFPAAIQRLLYYPPLQGKPADQKKPGIGEHTDYEVFTVLRQDEVGGLEVKNLSGQCECPLPLSPFLSVVFFLCLLLLHRDLHCFYDFPSNTCEESIPS